MRANVTPDPDPILTIAVVSDLHAFENCGTRSVPSHLRISAPEDQPGKNPIAGLRRLISELRMKADLLVCPGDLGDRAEPAGIQYAWKAIVGLGPALGGAFVAASSGNHDLDSRYQHSNYDTREVLQALEPSYPVPAASDETNDRYWSRQYAFIQNHKYHLLVVNSSAYHGGKPDEIDHGRVSDNTLEKIRTHLSSGSPPPLGVLLCHHHPQQQMEIGLGELDFMRNGQGLLDLLGSGEFGRWLVVHGHKHCPKVSYAAGSSSSPVVLSAGSLCAVLYPELQTRIRNQFHLVKVYDRTGLGLGLAGTVHSWDWAAGAGWERAGVKSGLPYLCGFGFRGDINSLAARIAGSLTSEKEFWSIVRTRVPEVDYLVPQDMRALRIALRATHGLEIEETDGEIREIGRAL